MQCNKLARIFCVILSAVLVLSSAFAAEAKSVADYEKQKDKIEQDIENYEKKLSNLKKDMKSREEYVNTLEGKISKIQDKIDTLERQKSSLEKEINAIQKKIEATNNEIDKLTKDVEKKQKELEAAYEIYCQRLRAMYVSGSVSTIEVLLESEDMSSVLTRAEMVKSVSAQDSKTLHALMEKMEEIRKQKQELENKKVELKEDKANLDKRKAELQKSIDDVNSSKNELKSEIAECNNEIKALAKTSNQYLETIHDNQKELDDIERAIKNASNSNNGGGNYTPGTGRLAYPTSVRKISAGYPNYSSGRYHGGVDFACPTGTSVYAADNGYVAMVKYLNYSYGYHILINHGNGLSTLYAHNSQILVHQGQSVSKGQLIAKSGSTGNSTGPHLHFEVRLNGNRVNPLSYLG